uniref:Poly [ADP-ribose] polymerase n=1 Tax=Chromera velia CCMP2878 TaxID=1169474 RepID=A0A0G4FYU5_9ALVE|eukprot:Cvel_19367.t1-p1 / transcript=Cvel_19367.t1 / gene=Cvel_19367 / organism=Chromera_velia_CCMP2878 / gene_product=hypothetical protein / transcript_product=hypothetical protein / location=Cvel_scaffold1664:30823-32223(+) / protein_length=467 / sequence_SO=supercontig / SO=protein_coding / is_pseudo=false
MQLQSRLQADWNQQELEAEMAASKNEVEKLRAEALCRLNKKAALQREIESLRNQASSRKEIETLRTESDRLRKERETAEIRLQKKEQSNLEMLRKHEEVVTDLQTAMYTIACHHQELEHKQSVFDRSIAGLNSAHRKEKEEIRKTVKKEVENAVESAIARTKGSVLESALSGALLPLCLVRQMAPENLCLLSALPNLLRVPSVIASLQAFIQASCKAHRVSYRSTEMADPPQVEILDVRLAAPEETLRSGFAGKRKKFLEEKRAWKPDARLFHGSRNPLLVPQNRHIPCELWKEIAERHPCLDLHTLLGGEAPSVSRKSIPAGEILLFHGCSDEVAEKISGGGFDWRLAGVSSGAMFGMGSYFALDFSKADLYAGEPSRRFLRHKKPMTVVIASVLLGRPYEAREPHKGIALPPDGCDSIWGVPRSVSPPGEVDHSEFVIFDKDQALPLLLVRYKHKRSCSCSRCRT